MAPPQIILWPVAAALVLTLSACRTTQPPGYVSLKDVPPQQSRVSKPKMETRS
jgi:hypothetical protein